MQKTFGSSVGMESKIPAARHHQNLVECSDERYIRRINVYYDANGGAHSNKKDQFEADVQLVTDLLNRLDKRACEYATEHEDYATCFVHILDEDRSAWEEYVIEWALRYLNGHERAHDIAERVYNQIDSYDTEAESIYSDYAAYNGDGCCLAQFEIGEIEEQVDINSHPVLKALHEQGRLDDILDHVNTDCYINRSQRRVKNEDTGRYENVGRDTYMPYDWESTCPTLLFYTLPGGQWAFVVPKERMIELVEEGLLALTKITVSEDELRSNGYIKIVEQSDDGEVTIMNEDGGLEVFGVCDSHSGWCIETECGKVLEFCRSI